ncbi:MAG: hypothetical protein HY021_02425 [Burkholderiales bacterium]|nr:hypothetical protein [Burkholderiales bacterium]
MATKKAPAKKPAAKKAAAKKAPAKKAPAKKAAAKKTPAKKPVVKAKMAMSLPPTTGPGAAKKAPGGGKGGADIVRETNKLDK